MGFFTMIRCYGHASIRSYLLQRHFPQSLPSVRSSEVKVAYYFSRDKHMPYSKQLTNKSALGSQLSAVLNEELGKLRMAHARRLM